MRVGWTGHRPSYFLSPADAEATVHRVADELRRAHGASVTFVTGGQQGVDLWAAAAAQRLGVRFEVLLPWPLGLFAAGWSESARQDLERAWAGAAERQVLDPSRAMGPGAYTLRNQAIAERCDLLVAVWTGRTGGGTHETVSFARALGKPVQEVLLPGADIPSEPADRGL